MQNPIVTFELESGTTMKAELYPEIAPNTVRNFVELIQKGFYNGLVFHRVIPGFMMQGGCPEGSGMGGPGYGIDGEFDNNNFKNDLKHTDGVLSMARSQNRNSAGSQFFVMVADSPHLDGQYASFGKVIENLEAFKGEVLAVGTDASDRPKKEQKLKSVTVDTFGEEYEPATKNDNR